jgi:hypothetical protein
VAERARKPRADGQRHRENLFLAASTALRETAAELLETGDAETALRGWMDRFAAQVATERGMATALQDGLRTVVVQ